MVLMPFVLPVYAVWAWLAKSGDYVSLVLRISLTEGNHVAGQASEDSGAAFYTCLYVWALDAETVTEAERIRVKPPGPLAQALA